MAASLFGTGSTVNVNVNGTLVPQSFIATESQTLFTLSGWTYTPGTNSLIVFINGDKQQLGKDFLETSSSSFTLVEGCIAGDNVEVIGFPQLTLSAVTAGAVNLGGSYTLASYIASNVINVDAYPYNATGDGVTDNGTAINAAIQAANAAGGGVVRLSPGRTYAHVAGVVLLPNVVLDLNTSTLKCTGSPYAAVSTQSTGVTINSGALNGTIDAGTATTCGLQLLSTYHCFFKDLTIYSVSSTLIALELNVNTSGGTNPDGNRNNVFNVFENILQEGSCGQALRLKGNITGVTVVTLNTFINFNSRNCYVYGINFDSWCDSNYFAGITRVSILGNNSVGVIWNSGAPTSNVGVYANNFDHLAVDTFGTYVNRVGIVMNWTKINQINYYFQDPQAEGGAYVFSANCQSYFVNHQVGLTGHFVVRQKLYNLAGKDAPILGVGSTDEITTESVQVLVGVNRTGSGFSLLSLIGDTTYTSYGTRLERSNGGANTDSSLKHRGTGNLQLWAEDVGGQVTIRSQNGVKFAASNTGIAFNGNTVIAQPTGYGTPTGVSKINNFPGTAATLAQTGGTLAALIADLKALGLIV